MRFLAGCWIRYMTLLAFAGTGPVLAETGSIAPEARTSYGVLQEFGPIAGTRDRHSAEACLDQSLCDPETHAADPGARRDMIWW
jgi:hypothetical protein